MGDIAVLVVIFLYVAVIVIGGFLAFRSGFKSRVRSYGLSEHEVEMLWQEQLGKYRWWRKGL